MVIVVESDDHVYMWQMAGLVVAVVGGVGFWVQNAAEANERKKVHVAGCERVSGLPRRSRHNRHARTSDLNFSFVTWKMHVR